MNVDVGQIIAGKYELVRLLGKGAMGEVWLATHNSLEGEFAIKLIEPNDDIEAETAAGRFQFEAQIAAKLSRKTRHIVSVSDHGEEEGLAYLVMELLEGESLEQKIRRMGSLDLPEVAAVVLQVARALSLAHEEGIFHRDLKPANVWLARDEEGRLLVKLLDFGIARSQKPFRTRSPFVTSKDMVLGTPSYMSPEQARGLDTLDHRCDLWALAVMAYEGLTNTIPFEGETIEDIFLSICTFRIVPALRRRADLPPMIDRFFERAFAPNLDERFTTAAELTEAFEQLVTPEQLELALGTPISPSARRLEAVRGSRPNLDPFPTSSSAMGVRDTHGSAPNLSPHVGVGYGVDPMPERAAEPTVITRRSGGMGWILAGVGLLALFGISFATVVGIRGASKADSSASPSATETRTIPTALPSNTVATTTLPPTPTAKDVVEPPTPKTATAVRPKPGTPPLAVTAVTPATAVSVQPPPPATTAASPPPPPPPPPPTPAPAKTIKKSEVL